MQYQNEHRYDDMLKLPHYHDPDRPYMSNHDRAAQFSPFAALTGYDAAVKETARLTQQKPEPSEGEIELLNRQLLELSEQTPTAYPVTIIYFQPDLHKEGGACVEKTGFVKKVDTYRKQLLFSDGTQIPVENILSITRETENVDFPESEVNP